ncbi:MAG TPA: hypothetical protein VJP79_09615 [Nitrososphaera sp.]|nr:hypothetical protein [Nitrososphaera sp.]
MFQANKFVLLGVLAAVGVALIALAINDPVLLGFATASSINDNLTNSTVTLSADELEEERLNSLIPSKNRAAYAAALADPRVSKYTSNALNIDQDFSATEESNKEFDELSMIVTGKQEVTGDWQTKEVWTYSNIVNMTVLLNDGVVQSVDVSQAYDHVKTVTFNDEDKAIIKAALDNADVAKLVAKIPNFYIFGVYHGTYFENGDFCPAESCVVANIAEENTKNSISVWVNTAKMDVVRIATHGWDKI